MRQGPGWRALGAIFLVALAVRLLHDHVAGAAGLFDGLFLDSHWYAERAAEIRVGRESGGAYQLSPLYPYLLALFTNPAGVLDLDAVRVLQSVCGAASAVFCALIAARLGGRRAAWIGGIATALYAPWIHVGSLILAHAFQGALLVAGVWLALEALLRTPDPDRARVDRRRTLALWASAGLCMGLASAAHPASLIAATALVPLAWWLARSARTSSALAYAGGVLLALAPFTLHNLRQGERVVLTASSGMNFWIGNGQDAPGVFRTPPGYDFAHDPLGHTLIEHDTGRKLSDAEASAAWSAKAWREIGAAPGHWLALLSRKALYFLHSGEIPQLGESFGWFRERAWTLRAPLDGRTVLLFALAAPFALLLLGERERLRVLLLPAGVLAAYATGIVCFFVNGRYRAAVMPIALAIAACGAVALWDLAVRGTWKRPLAVLALLGSLAALFATSWWLYDSAHAPFALRMSTGVEDRHQGMALYAEKRYAEATLAYRRALALEDDPTTRTNLANALKALGRFDEALEQYQLVLTHHPRDGIAWYDLGNLLRTHQKDLRGAADAYRKAIEFLPKMPEAQMNLGAVLLDLDQPEDAGACFEAALSLAPPDASWRKQAEDARVQAHLRQVAKERQNQKR